MSHFVVMVIGDDVDKQLEPYNENTSVKPYKRKCYCVGSIARRDANTKVDKEYKTIDQLRQEFKNEKTQTDRHWQTFIAKYLRLQRQFTKKHPLYNKPDPKCSDCKGTGIATSTYNRDSKWDWFSVGGRWKGFLLTKDGRRVDQAKKSEIDWNGMKVECRKEAEKHWAEIMKLVAEKKGTEASLMYNYKGQSKEKYLKAHEDISPYAVVKDSVWYEKGHMGWWGMSRSEKRPKVWQEMFMKLINYTKPSELITIVDCHI